MGEGRPRFAGKPSPRRAHRRAYNTSAMKKLPPTHPGEVLLEDFTKPIGLSQYRVAADIGVGRCASAKSCAAGERLPPIPLCGWRAILATRLAFGSDSRRAATWRLPSSTPVGKSSGRSRCFTLGRLFNASGNGRTPNFHRLPPCSRGVRLHLPTPQAQGVAAYAAHISTQPAVRPLALVTGASSGLGSAFAGRFVRDQYDLVLVARRRELLQDLAQRLAREHGQAVAVIPTAPASPRLLVAGEARTPGGRMKVASGSRLV
jgi:short chain dehydrogenase